MMLDTDPTTPLGRIIASDVGKPDTKRGKTDSRLSGIGLIILGILIIPGMLIGAARGIQFGWSIPQVLEMVAYLALIATLLLQNFLPTSFRLVMTISAAFLLATTGVFHWGISSGAPTIYLALVIVMALLWGTKPAWYVALLSIIILVTVGVLVMTGVKEYSVNFDEYVRSPFAWLTVLINFTIIAAAIIAAMNRLHSAFLSTIQDLKQRTEDLEILNERLETEVRERGGLEQQLYQAQKMEAVGQLAGGVAHDFNNLLHAIHGFTYISRSQIDKDHKARQNLDEVMEATRQASEMVKQLMTFSRTEELRSDPLDLNDVIGSQLGMIGRLIGEHIELNFSAGSNLKMIVGDPTKIEQVLMNLCVNSRDAMPGGGRIDITTSNTVIDDDAVKKNPRLRSGDFIEVTVEDGGNGMGAEILDRIFEPFFTTKDVGKGTGLGLASVYGIVEQHNGFIDVESTIGEGTTFSIFLPVTTSKEIEDRHRRKQATLPPTGNETILLAEDSDIARKMAVSILEEVGYSVLVACDGQEAVQIFNDNADVIDLAILDVVLPRGHGRAVFESIRKHSSDLPVLFLSGYSRDLVDTIVQTDATAELIHKPIEPPALLSNVRRLLDLRSQRQAPSI